jgi:hypothetical protein
MTSGRVTGPVAVVCLLAFARPAMVVAGDVAPSPDPVGVATAADATVLRVFLRDGRSLVSYGELARVGDRVVFSMPTTASMATPQLHLVNLPAEQVDWAKTDRYAESARAARYLATRADNDYAVLSGEIAQALNDIALTSDPARRLAIVEKARKTLADWPPSHFNYKQEEVRQMLGILDEAIADLRAAAGLDRFDLSFVAGVVDTPLALEPLLPLPTPKEAIEQTFLAAGLAESPAERTSLFAMALTTLARDAAVLPADWIVATRVAAEAGIARELEMDRVYQSLTSRTLGEATRRARAADVRGLQRLLTQVHERDAELGAQRPDTIVALIASVEAQLDAARKLRLARDRWELRQPEYRKYGEALTTPLEWLDRLKSPLEDIKALAGSSPRALASLQRAAGQALDVLAAIVPPDDFRSAHALFVSGAQLAENAARLRREAALASDMARAWDASSAAAGALMLTERARSEIQALFRFPQLAQ